MILFQLEILCEKTHQLECDHILCVCVLYIWIQKTDVIPISLLKLTKNQHVVRLWHGKTHLAQTWIGLRDTELFLNSVVWWCMAVLGEAIYLVNSSMIL